MNAILLSVISFVSCTTCPQDIRGFLNIPANARCDMVKWRFEISDDGSYTLNTQWGYYVNNRTFTYTGALVDSRGTYDIRDKRFYTLKSERGSLSLLKLNENMFHLLDKNNKISQGGEGYANILNREKPVIDKTIDFVATKNEDKDFVLTGRTPLKPFDKELPIADSEDHDKIKWMIKFHADGTVEVREILEHVRDWKGTWTIENNIYKLNFEGRKLSLARLSDDVYIFVSQNGGLITGNHEFGSALIRRPQSD